MHTPKKNKRFFFTNHPSQNTNDMNDKAYSQITQPSTDENSNTNQTTLTDTQTLLTEEMKLTIENAKKSEEKINQTTQAIHEYIDKEKSLLSKN